MSDSPWTPPINPAAGNAVRPKEVDLAFWILVVWSIVGVIAGAVSFFFGDGMAQMQQQMAGAQMDPETASIATNAGAIGGVVGGVIAVAFWVFFGVKMRQGRNWARIVITVFGAIAIIANLVGISSGPTPILSVLGLLAYGAVIVLMYRPAANPYFAPRPAVG